SPSCIFWARCAGCSSIPSRRWRTKSRADVTHPSRGNSIVEKPTWPDLARHWKCDYIRKRLVGIDDRATNQLGFLQCHVVSLPQELVLEVPGDISINQIRSPTAHE